MKILWKNPTTETINGIKGFKDMISQLEEQLNEVANNNTDIIIKSLDKSTNSVRSFYGEFLNNYYVVESILKEQKDYDAIIIGCFPDPGIEVLKEIAEVPIIGLGEASMLMATTIAEKFAVISVDKDINPNMEQSILKYGLKERTINRPIREVSPKITVEEDIEGYLDPYKIIIPKIESTAKQCIEEGAGALLTGCGYMGPMLTRHNYNIIRGTNVPIVDSSAVAVKFAEMIVELKNHINFEPSRENYYKKIPRELFNTMRNNIGLDLL